MEAQAPDTTGDKPVPVGEAFPDTPAGTQALIEALKDVRDFLEAQDERLKEPRRFKKALEDELDRRAGVDIRAFPHPQFVVTRKRGTAKVLRHDKTAEELQKRL